MLKPVQVNLTPKVMNDILRNAPDNVELMIIDEDYGRELDLELNGFFKKLFRRAKRAVTPPARFRPFIKKAIRVVKRVAKKSLPILKKALPIVAGAVATGFTFGAGAPALGLTLAKLGGVGAKLGAFSKVAKFASPMLRRGLGKVVSGLASKLKGGGSGLFKNVTDVVNKVAMFKSSLKPGAPITEAMGLGRALGFNPKQIGDILTTGKVKALGKTINSKLFKYGAKPKFSLGIRTGEPAEKKPPFPVNWAKTPRGDRPIFRLFSPEYFKLGQESIALALYENQGRPSNLDLKFLTQVWEKGKEVVKSIIPSKQEKDIQETKELKEKRQKLLKNIMTLEKNLRKVKGKYNKKRTRVKKKFRDIIAKDIKDTEKRLNKLKKELAEVSDVSLGVETVNLAVAPLIVLGVAGAVAWVGGKIVDTIKMNKLLKRDAEILDSVRTGVITQPTATQILTKPLVTKRIEAGVEAKTTGFGLPLMLAVAGIGIFVLPQLFKGRRRRR